MSKHKIGGRAPRKPGAQVSYTAEQTARYQSLPARIERAQEILAAGLIEEIPSDQIGRELYFFPSERAPNPPGGWLVTVIDEEPDPEPYLPIPGATPAGGSGQQPGPNVYIASFGAAALDPGLPPELLRGIPIENYFPTTFLSALPLPWLEDETPAAGLTISNTLEGLGLAAVVVPPEAAGLTITGLIAGEIGFWVQFGKIYQFSPAGSAIVVLFKWAGPGPRPPAYTYNSDWLTYRIPSSGGVPLINPVEPFNVTAYPLGVDPNNPQPQPQPIDPAAPDMPEDPPLPIDPGRGNYECNCPDYSRIELQDPSSPFPSRWRDRVWIDSEAGAPVSADNRVYCKHVLAAMLKRGDPLP